VHSVDGKLSVGIIADPFIPVPPLHYGGIERVIAMLIDGLMGRGHSVVLWAAPGSRVNCELVEYGRPPHRSFAERNGELLQEMWGLWRRRRQFDVVHSFGRLAGLLPLLPVRIPKVQSYQREITPGTVSMGVRLAGDTLLYTACSSSVRANVSNIGRWETVYNGAPRAAYEFNEQVADDAPLVFLGRVERIKGPHTAIDVARRSGRRLVIAGNVPDNVRDQRFFESEIKPHVDGDSVRYVGPVGDRAKNALLGSAAAFLMPIEWEEPFGIVMAEALACGTPVIGLRRGSVPEVVEEGVSGFVCESAEEMADAVSHLGRIDRRRCRAEYERRFSDDAIVDAYLALYQRHIARVRYGEPVSA
jgi:glycosyltransferase involved in cell wall biosynthesis